ncbi:MAG: sugar-binding protein [Anaerolineaceae bacterium]|nr:sugar-binding protein [Anaerolineaceae bacterium]
MKKVVIVLVSLLTLMLALTACSLPFGNQPQQVVTPNLTLTALFGPAQTMPATVTPVYVVVTNTPEPATATPEPTNTTAPTATNTTAAIITSVPLITSIPPTSAPVMARGDNLMTAGYINFEPSIDGSWSEWKDYTTQYPVASVVYGKSNWTGPDDLQASYAAVWDYNYLYLGVKVYDDKYVQNATGQDLYKGDSVELLLDADLYNDFYTNKLSPDDYQLGISAGSGGSNPEAFLWFPSNVAGSRSSKVTTGFTTEDGLYRIESRIPWSVFGITPYAGMHLGIAVSVSDNDDSGSNKQQTMVSSAPYRNLLDPTSWREIVLSK